MNLGQLKQLRSSVLITGLLAGVMTLSACQQEPETDASLSEDIAEEQGVPMSAEPADPNDAAVAVNDASLSEVEDDTVASVNGTITQLTYLCTPALEIEATYNDDSDQVTLETDDGTVTLTKTNEGTNPEVFEVQTTMTGSAGFTQWRVAHEERETGVMRTAEVGATEPSTYECNKTQDSQIVHQNR